MSTPLSCSVLSCSWSGFWLFWWSHRRRRSFSLSLSSSGCHESECGGAGVVRRCGRDGSQKNVGAQRRCFSVGIEKDPTDFYIIQKVACPNFQVPLPQKERDFRSPRATSRLNPASDSSRGCGSPEDRERETKTYTERCILTNSMALTRSY